MTLSELVRTEKFQDAIGGGIGVLLTLAFYEHMHREPVEQVSACVEAPYLLGSRPSCVTEAMP